jgi:hypothetical protein
MMNFRAALSALCVVVSGAMAQSVVAQPLPEGNTGIASRYPGDVSIENDSSVVFVDKFETYSSASELTSRWNEAYHSSNLRIATESEGVFNGRQALELKIPQTSSEVSNNAVKYLSPKRDLLFVRHYAKFDAGYNVTGSSHNGASMSANYCCPGVRADGYNKFFVSLEAGRDDAATANPGKLNIYIYYPDQRDIWGDHFYPTGVVAPYTSVPYDFGSSFVSRPDFVPQVGRWYSYELMVKANTPGQRDGRIAIWIDGKLVADFTNLRLRDTTALQIDRFSVDFHVRSNTLGVAKKWVDNVVAATSYIGPMVPAGAVAPLPAPTNLRVLQ